MNTAKCSATNRTKVCHHEDVSDLNTAKCSATNRAKVGNHEEISDLNTAKCSATNRAKVGNHEDVSDLNTTEWSVADDEYVLHQVFQVVRAFAKTLNNEIYRSGIYSAEWTILTTVYKGKVQQQGDLIQYLALEPGAISRTLTKMEQKGLIKRTYRENERGKFIELTKKGQQLRQALEERVNAHRQRVLKGLSTTERQQLQKIMSTLQTNLAAEN